MRFLILAAIGLIFTSWFSPWWTCDIIPDEAELKPIYEAVHIRPWGLEDHLGSYSGYIGGSQMPAFFAPLMWIYLGLITALLLFSLFAKEKMVGLGKFKFNLPKLLIGGVGLSFIFIVALAAIVAAIRTGEFYNTKLMGTVYDFTLGLTVNSRLLFGYWLACGTGVFITILALLRDRITGIR